MRLELNALPLRKERLELVALVFAGRGDGKRVSEKDRFGTLGERQPLAAWILYSLRFSNRRPRKVSWQPEENALPTSSIKIGAIYGDALLKTSSGLSTLISE